MEWDPEEVHTIPYLSDHYLLLVNLRAQTFYNSNFNIIDI